MLDKTRIERKGKRVDGGGGGKRIAIEGMGSEGSARGARGESE